MTIQIGDKYQHGKDIVEVIDIKGDMVTFGWPDSNYWQTYKIGSSDFPNPYKPDYKSIVDKAIGEKPSLVKDFNYEYFETSTPYPPTKHGKITLGGIEYVDRSGSKTIVESKIKFNERDLLQQLEYGKITFSEYIEKKRNNTT